MIAVIQRAKKASVTIKNALYSEISYGFVVLLGIYKDDTENDMKKIVSKLLNLRIMSDTQGKMNKSILDTQGHILIVSQFTLCADTSAGRRPSFIHAMPPDKANELYKKTIEELKVSGLTVKTGEFGADMTVEIHNDGPVTILLDSKTL